LGEPFEAAPWKACDFHSALEDAHLRIADGACGHPETGSAIDHLEVGRGNPEAVR
jgi:hypothetical protein